MTERAEHVRHRVKDRTIARLVFFLVAAWLLLGAVAAASDTLVVDDHRFEYLGVEYNADGTSTWTYRVTSGEKPSLSHWVLEFDSSMGDDAVVDASEGLSLIHI